MEEAFITYMRNIAVQLKDIGHTQNDERYFHVKSIFETEAIQNKVKNLPASVILISESPEGLLDDFGSDNVSDIKRAAFILLKKGEPNMLNDSIHDEVHAIAKKIFGRMRKDSREKTIHHFKLNVDYQKIGPTLGSRYGYRYEFEWGMSITDLKYNSNDWNL